MEVYAAQIACLDQNVGLLIQCLKDLGIFENTVIIFLSDNGACAEEVNKSKGVQIGGADSFVSYGKNWANVSNTPYRLYKSFTHEGGILTPMIFSWPKGLQNPGLITVEPAHINDIMPVCLELAGAKYPKSYAGNKIYPLDGLSFLPILSGREQKTSRTFYFQHEGNEAIRKEDWKLVKRFAKDWGLFYMKDDPAEMNDLSKVELSKQQELLDDYNNWGKEYGVLPWPIKR
jgi:arylsulfatase